MSDMKCPKCGGRLVYWGATGALLKCEQCKFGWGNEELWQELIKLMEDKDLSDKIGKLKTELDRTRKALEIAKDTFNWIDETYQTGQEMEAEIWGKVQLAAQEITATLENQNGDC